MAYGLTRSYSRLKYPIPVPCRYFSTQYLVMCTGTVPATFEPAMRMLVFVQSTSSSALPVVVVVSHARTVPVLRSTVAMALSLRSTPRAQLPCRLTPAQTPAGCKPHKARGLNMGS